MAKKQPKKLVVLTHNADELTTPFHVTQGDGGALLFAAPSRKRAYELLSRMSVLREEVDDFTPKGSPSSYSR